MKSFVNNGYIILKKAIPNSLVIKIQQSILNSLGSISKNNVNKNYEIFSKKILSMDKSISPYDLLVDPYIDLEKNRLIHKMLNSKKIYSELVNLIGKDLSFVNDPSLVLNIPKKNSSKKNYLFKDWHQEIWSGASHLTLQTWTPCFQRSSNSGQIELIPESHTWGHIPHSDRKPTSLPNKYKTIKTNLEYGDIIIFHSMLIHRSLPIFEKSFSPRLSLPCLVKNFRFKNDSFEYLRNWKIFSYSDISIIERKLGNHYLSPYRIVNLKTNQTSSILKK